MSHLIPISQRDFKTLSKQYLSTLKAQAAPGEDIPTLMQAQELLAKACGHQSLHEATLWWSSQPKPTEMADTQPDMTPTFFGHYNIERAMSDQANVERLRQILLDEASMRFGENGSFSLFEVRRAAETRLSGHDIYTLFHVSKQMVEDGTFIENDENVFSINEHVQWAPPERKSPGRRM